MKRLPKKTIADRLLVTVLEQSPQEEAPKSRMSEICGISQPAVYQWYSGKTKEPKASHIGAICAFYDGDLAWVINGPLSKRKHH